MRASSTLVAALLLAAAAPAFAQDDFEVAECLSQRGWFDLAEELLKKVENSSSFTPEQRAEAKYGLAKLISTRAEREGDVKKKGEYYDIAIANILEFTKNFPKHARCSDALSDVGYLFQQKGKFLMSQGRSDPEALTKAEAAFKSAESLFTELSKALKEKQPERPTDPADKRGNEAYDEWEQKMMNAKYNYGISLFAHAEALKDSPGKLPQMKELLDQMVKFFEGDFMWEYERYLLAFDAFIYMGRGFQLLAETSDGANSDNYWKKCFNYIGKAKGLLADKELRKDEGVRDVAERAYYFEIKARMVYGDSRKGGSATKQYLEAAKLAEDLFKLLPKLDDQMAKAIKLEQGRAYYKAGKATEGKALLTALSKDPRNKETWIESAAIDILGEYAGETDVKLAIDAADNIYERGGAFLYQAITKYRRALQAIKKKEDQPLLGHCWLQIGLCYFYLDRYYEAIAAFSRLEDPLIKSANPKLASDAALRKLTALKKVKITTKDPADQTAYDDFLRWATGTYPKQIGSSGKREAAISAEDRAKEFYDQKKLAEAADKYREAADVWGQIASDPGDPFYEEAIFTAGFDYYRRGDCFQRTGVKADEPKAADAFTKAIEMFTKHLGVVDKMPTKEKTAIKNAVGSVLFSCKVYLSRTVNKPEKALEISNDLEKRYPGAESRYVMAIMSQRIDAKLDLNRMGEAEEDLKSLKSIYQKEGTGVDFLSRALGLLAQGCELAASKVDKDKERELYDNLSIKAASYYYDYFQINPPDPRRDADKLNVIADKLFLAAQTRIEKARAASDKPAIEEASGMFEKARDLFAQYRSSGAKIDDETQQLLRQKEARCFLETGKFDMALEVYREIAAADPQMQKGSVHEDLADCYMFQARSMATGSDRTKMVQKADATYGALAARLMEKGGQHFFRLLYKHADALWETDLEALRNLFSNMTKRGYGPAWDDGKWGFQTKFEDLRKKLEEKLPAKDK